MSMMNASDSKRRPSIIELARLNIRLRFCLFILIFIHIAVCCVSLVRVADHQSYMLYDANQLNYALAAVLAFSTVSLLFIFARFSFGYFVGFYFYTVVLGFIWLSCFTKFNYDHTVAGLSAAVSMLLFLLPALLINTPIKQVLALSPKALEQLLGFILALAAITIAAASVYNFRLVSLRHIYDFRNELYFPAGIRYLMGIASTALLPFAFACYLALNRHWHAGAALLLMLLFFPITLSKFALFSAAWMVALLALSKIFESRVTTILSLLLPMLVGVILIGILPNRYALSYFGMVNIRMIATPASAMDIYNDFFSYHPLTYFCQISFLSPLMNCPYQDPLSIVMEKAYGIGNFNASLFATEGVASVGLLFAPLAVLVCGLVVALGNRASAGLPPRFILISAALLPQAFLNVPFTTALLTHGTAILFLLWYVTPRTLFETEIEPGRSLAGPAR
jgi:hypothetical protein